MGDIQKLIDAVNENDDEIVAELIKHGNLTDENKSEALTLAIKLADVEVVECFIKHGVKPNNMNVVNATNNYDEYNKYVRVYDMVKDYYKDPDVDCNVLYADAIQGKENMAIINKRFIVKLNKCGDGVLTAMDAGNGDGLNKRKPTASEIKEAQDLKLLISSDIS